MSRHTLTHIAVWSLYLDH